MAVKRYVGDKIVGLNSEKAAVLDTVSDGALYYTNDSPYVVYLKKDGAWQQISSSAGGGSELTNSGQILHRDIHVVSGDVVLNTADIDIVSGDLLNTGQILHRDVHVVSGNLHTTGDRLHRDIHAVSGNLHTTGDRLHRDVHAVSGRIDSNDTDITNLTTNLDTTGNLLHRDVHVISGRIATDSTLGNVKFACNCSQSTAPNIFTDTTDRSYAVTPNSTNQMVVNVPWIDSTANLDTTGNLLHRDVHVVSGNLHTTGDRLHRDVHAVSGRIDSNDTDIANLTTNLDTTGNILHRDIHVVSGVAHGKASDVFKTIAVQNSDDVVAAGITDTLTFVAGSNTTITTDSSNQTVTICSAGAAGGEANVQSDWTQSSNTSDAFILNKPGILGVSSNYAAGSLLPEGNATHGGNFLRKDGSWAIPFALSAATNSALGGIKIGYTTNAKKYAVQLDSEKAYVDVPWTDTDTWQQVSTSQVGYVAALPSSNGSTKFLRGDGSWEVPNYDTTNTTYDLAVPNSTTNIALTGSNSTTDTIQLVGGTNVTLSCTASNQITITSSDQYTGTVTGVTGTSPITSSGGATPAISLANSGVTYAKIQNVSATNRILGRDSTGAGVIEEITPASLRTMLEVAQGATACEGTVTSVAGGAGLTAGGTAADPSLSLDTATSTALGGIKVGTRLSITNGILSADLQTDNNTTYGVSAVDDSGIKLRLTDSGSTTDDVKFAAGNLLGVAKVSSEDTICFTTTATANDTDANLKNRTNHTGTQAASTISDFDTEVANNTTVVAHTTKLAGIEDGATADQTATEICAAAGITSALGTNAFSSTAFTTCEGTVTSVTGGAGLTAGGTAADPSISLDKATSTALGGIKVSTGLTINASTGALSVTVPTTHNFTNDLKTKLDNIEVGATADLTATEICALAGITGNIQSNAYTSTTIPTDNDQLANGCGYTTNIGTVTPSSSDTFTNKSGNISQWTNDANYSTTVGTVTSVTAASPLTATTGATPQISLPVSACVTINNLCTCGTNNCVHTGILCSVFICNTLVINSGLFHGGNYSFTGNINTSGTLNHGTNHWIKTNMLCTCGTNACIVSDGGNGLIKGCFSGDGSAITNLDIEASDLPNIAKCEGTVTTVTVGAGLCLHSTANSFTVSDTICNTDKGSSQNIFKNIGAYNGGTLIGTVVAATNDDTVCFVQGSNITLTHATDKITIAADNTTYNQATDSALGLVKLSGTPADNVTDTAITSNYIHDNLKTPVPAGAKFTDTCYSQANSSTLGLVKISDSADNNANDTAISADWAYETLTIPSLNILGNNTGSAAEASGLTCAQVLSLLGTVSTANNFTTVLKNKLDGICAGATANDTNANLLARANHTGTQTASTISDFDTEVANNTAVAANTLKQSAFSASGGTGYVCPTGLCTNYCAAVSSANAFVGCNTNNCVDVTTVKASTLVDVSSGSLNASCIDVGTQTATGAITALKLCGAGTNNCVEVFCGKFTFLNTLFSMTALQLCATGANNCVEASCLKGDYDAADLTGTIDAARLPATALTSSSQLNATNLCSGTVNADRLPATAKCQGDITQVTPGTGLTGGGSTGNISVCLDLGNIDDSTTNSDGACFAVVNSSNVQKLLAKGSINISGFNNDSNFTSNTGTLTSSSQLNATNLCSGTVNAARLPIATASALGGIKVSTGLTINSSTGALSVTVPTANDFTNACSSKLSGLTTGFSAAGADSDFVCPRGSTENYCALIICSVGSNNCIKGSIVCATSALHGEGSNITDLDASEIKSGTVATTYLPAAALKAGTVTSVTAGSGMTQSGTSTINPTLNVIGGTGITANANDISITNISGLTAGSYTNANITVNAQGQVTLAASGSSSSGGGRTCNGASGWVTTCDSCSFCASKLCGTSCVDTPIFKIKNGGTCYGMAANYNNGGYLMLRDTCGSSTNYGSDYGTFFINGCNPMFHDEAGNTCYFYMSSSPSSDYRLKANLTCWSNLCCPTNVVKKVPVYSFNWNKEGAKNTGESMDIPKVGFLAHEMKEVLGQINTVVPEDKDQLNEDGSIKAQHISDRGLIPILWSALQETIKKVEDLEERVKTLESS